MWDTSKFYEFGYFGEYILQALRIYLLDEITFQASASAEEFMQKLPQFDPDMTKERQAAADAEEVSISMIL